jgi:hypothetical protein
VRWLPPTLALVLTVVFSGGVADLTTTSATSASPSSAQALLQGSLAAAQASGSVHMVDQTKSGGRSEKLEGALSAPTAGEVLTAPGSSLQVELIGGVVYVNGSAAAITTALQITAAQAAPEAGMWIAVSSTDAPFQTLTQALTISAALSEFTPINKGVHLGRIQNVDGHKVQPIIGIPSGLTGGNKSSVALLVSTKAPHLPLGGTLIVANKTQRLSEVAVFGSWGTKVSLTAPTTTVPFSSVLTG